MTTADNTGRIAIAIEWYSHVKSKNCYMFLQYEMIIVWITVSAFIHLLRMFLSTDFLIRITDWPCHLVLYIRFTYYTEHSQKECSWHSGADHSGYGLSGWDPTVGSHWLNPYTEWPLSYAVSWYSGPHLLESWQQLFSISLSLCLSLSIYIYII